MVVICLVIDLYCLVIDESFDRLVTGVVNVCLIGFDVYGNY